MTLARNDRGFALVAVLWTIMIVALIAASIMITMRGDTSIAHARRQTAELTALADGGINTDILRLLDINATRRPLLDGTPFEVAFGGRTMTVRVQDESGKIDLNSAPGELLQRLLASTGLNADDAQIEADRILDWREAGDLRRLNGAKRDDYSNAGLPYGPRLGPFPSVAELKLVMGITPELFASLQPAITVYSQQADINPVIAPREALSALPEMDAEAVARTLLARHPDDDSDAAQQYSVVQQDLSGHAFTISATIMQGGRTATRTAVIRLSGDMQNPIWVYSWK